MGGSSRDGMSRAAGPGLCRTSASRSLVAPMPPSDRWNRFARADEAVLRRAQDAAVVRYLREELAPFSRHYRTLFEREGFEPRATRGAADLAALPATEPRDLLRAQGLEAHRNDFLLRPTPGAVKASWSFQRKLALSFGGRRSHQQLARTYTPCFRTRERVGDDWLFTQHTRFDLEVLGEHGARAFGFLGLDRPGERLLSLVEPGPGIDHWAILQAGWQTGTQVAHDLRADEPALVEDFAPTAIAGDADGLVTFLDALRAARTTLGELKLALLVGADATADDKRRVAEALTAHGATDPTVCRALALGLARALWVEPPADVDAAPGFLLSPDLAFVEVVRPGTTEPAAEGEAGELLLSSLAARGTAVLRYRTGLAVGGPLDWSRCSWSGYSLPRLASDLRAVR